MVGYKGKDLISNKRWQTEKILL